MNILSLLFLASLVAGQLISVSPWPGVVVYVHDIVLAALVITILFQAKKTKVLMHRALLVPIGLFALASVVSLFANILRFPLPELGLGSLYLVRWMLYAAVYFIVCAGRKDFSWGKGLYGVGVSLGVLGLMQFVWYPDLRNLMYLGWDPHYYRVFSTLLDPNFTGIMLVLTLILGFGLWQTEKKRVLLVIGQITTFSALLLTYSRSSFLALAAAILVWAILKKQWKLLPALVAFFLLLTVLPKIPGDTLKLTRLDSSLARIGNWQESIGLIARAPIFGYGFDTLRYLRPGETDVVSKAAAGLDSSILFVFATTGVVGAAAYGFLVFSMVRLGMRASKKKAWIAGVYLTSFAALTVHSLFVNSLFYPWVLVWMWALTGLVEHYL